MEFPKIMNPDYPLKEEYEDNSISSTFEDGSVQARRKFTRSRGTFSLSWGELPTAQYNTLRDFVTKQAFFSANAFSWTHPVTKKQYTVYIKKDSFKASLAKLNYWNVQIDLVEV